MADEERKRLTYDEAVAMLPDGESIHTFRNPGILIGADWMRSAVLEIIKVHGAELAGELATKMNHAIYVNDGKGSGQRGVWIETRKRGKG